MESYKNAQLKPQKTEGRENGKKRGGEKDKKSIQLFVWEATQKCNSLLVFPEKISYLSRNNMLLFQKKLKQA